MEGTFTRKLLSWKGCPPPQLCNISKDERRKWRTGVKTWALNQDRRRRGSSLSLSCTTHLPSASSTVQDSASILNNSKETETQSQDILAEQMLKTAATRNLMSQWELAWKKEPSQLNLPLQVLLQIGRQTQVVCNRGERSKCLALSSTCETPHETEEILTELGVLELEFWLNYLSVCNLRQVCPLF